MSNFEYQSDDLIFEWDSEKGECAIAIVTYILHKGAPLTTEQRERLKLLENMTDEDIVYDEECPPQTDEQLKQFKRVNPRCKEKATG